MALNVATPAASASATGVQGASPPVRIRALIPGDRASGYRETITDVVDTGRRRPRKIEACFGAGQKQVGNVEALVHVPGEREPWWIDAERLEPEGYEARAAWLRAAEDDRPAVERHEDGRGVGYGKGARVAVVPRRSREAAAPWLTSSPARSPSAGAGGSP